MRKILVIGMVVAFLVVLGLVGSAQASNFTIVVLPDTQYYSASYPSIFTSQTQWIVNNTDNLNIGAVIHVGDIVDSYSSTAQWENANSSMSILDNNIPYLVVPGNHDTGATADYAYYNNYFGYTRFENYTYYGGHYPTNGNQNNYGLFTFGSQKYLIMGLDFCPCDDVLNWAENVMNTFPDREVILFMHSYMNYDNTRVDPGDSYSCSSYGLSACNNGEELWTKFITKHPNIVLVTSGHILSDGLGKRTDYVDGYGTHQILQNYQILANGGNGYLRYYTFNLTNRTIEAKTYSPYLGNYDTATDNQFTLSYKPREFHFITDLDVEKNAVLEDNHSINTTSTGEIGTESIVLGNNRYSNYSGIVDINFSSANVSFSGVTIDTNRTSAKSVLCGTSTISGVTNQTLLIPRINNLGTVYICEGATNLSDVSEANADVYINTGETVDGMTVSEVTIEGQDYYKVVGINGTGGGEGEVDWSAWSKKRPIQINNTDNPNNLTDYQVFMNITYDSDMNNDFSDIRVVNETSGEAVPYWIEDKVNGSWADVWFNVSYIPASSWLNNTYYLYYNNSVATSTSNITTTFIIGDDFEVDNISGISDVWNITGTVNIDNTTIYNNSLGINSGPPAGYVNTSLSPDSYIFEFLATFTADETFGTIYLDNGHYARFGCDSNDKRSQYYDGGALINIHDYGAANSDWNLYKLVANGTGIEWYRDNTLDNTMLDNGSINEIEFSAPSDDGDSYSGYSRVDNARVRKYASPEPTIEVGAEEIVQDTTFTVTLPAGYTNIHFNLTGIAHASTQTNFSPEGQNDTISMLEVTNTGNVNLTVRLNLNTTLADIILKGDTDNNSAGASEINTSYNTLYSDLPPNSSTDIWLWSDFSHTVAGEVNRSMEVNVTQ